MRNLNPATGAALSANNVGWTFLAMFAFRTLTQYLWTGPGPLTVAGQTYTGLGDFGTIGELMEGTDGKAEGTSVTLSGISPGLLAESMTDIRQGAPAKIWLALLNPDMTVIGTPYLWFSGTIDGPPIAVGGEKMSITLKLENPLANHERASSLKYTSADQRLLYADDTAFDWVEKLNDISLRWGV